MDEYGVKRYIDPDVDALGLPTELTRPSLAMVRNPIIVLASDSSQIETTRPVVFSDLTADEREQLR